MSKRNIAFLIRRVSSAEVGHPMDSGQSVSDSGEPKEGASVCTEKAVAEPNQPTTDTTAGQGVVGDTSPLEKKKPKQFDFSMYVYNHVAVFITSVMNVGARVSKRQLSYCTCTGAYLWGAVVRVPAAKAGGPGFDSRRLPWIFFFFNCLILMHIDEGSVVL